MKERLLLAILALPLYGITQTQEMGKLTETDTTNSSKIFELGEVTITGSRGAEFINGISTTSMEGYNKMEVSKALDMLPGINLTASGQRNESMISVRGFDLRAVPIYMDGIPVYVPYDGYVDLARFTTFDLSAIDVSKGFSSIMYGPNSLGGAINLISRKPAKELEFDGAIGMINQNGYKSNLNIGTKQKKFYVQGGISYLQRDSYIMSAQYDSTKNENGKERDNSYRTDQKYTIKAGWTPNEKHEYVLGYINQRGQKGTPLYCGTDTLNSLYKKPRYWQWPAWNKETYYFLSNTVLNYQHYIKTRFYYDAFKNLINSYDNDTYSTQDKPYAFKSYYNDYTYGGMVEYGTKILPKNQLKLSLQFKEDVHRENDLNEPVQNFFDRTETIGVEDIFRVSEKMVIIPGISYSERNNLRAEEYNSNTEIVSEYAKAGASNALNEQLGVFYYLKANHKLGAAVSNKTRFATIKERYSYRMGTAIPNPDLKPERATNYEINYNGKFFNKWVFNAAIFYNHINDAILSVSNVKPGKSQMQNMGKAEFTGAETSIQYEIPKNILLAINYTHIKRNNLTDPTVKFTDVPESKVFGNIQYRPIRQIGILASVEYNSSRYSTSYGTQADSFTIVNSAISGNLWKYLSLEVGVNNLFDKYYGLVEGYPEEGRNYYVTLRFFNHH
ncbi:MAG: TonB-dependent receptor [Crocinitomicaceae bacterium]|nr:TonB-dependent receptor [Crocinitomicaceae bacterium]